MRKRQFKFIVALCFIAVVIWIAGECLLGLVFDLGMTVSRIWAIFIVVATCAISLWKCPRSDKNGKGEKKK